MPALPWARRSIREAALITIGLIALSAPTARRAGAATLCVAPGGAGGCFASIAAAVDAAVSRDTVQIAAGTYVEQVDIQPRKGFLTIDGAGAGATVVSAPSPLAHVMIVRGGGTRPTVSNLTLTGGLTGAFVWDQARVSFVDVELTGNEIGLDSRGKATLLRSNVVDNADFGLRALVRGASLTVIDSTVSGNGIGGVRINSDSKAKIVGSTISGNGGDGIGFGAATVVSSTVANNALAGINVYRRSTLRSTIVAGNGGSSGDCDTSTVGSQLRVLGTSLVGDVGSCTIVAAAGLVLTGDPLLGPLQNNGGATATHELLPGSPAIGALTRTSLCKAPDQRGVPRSVPCDIGAFEAP